ncbi:unnamed protein product [Rotaria sp. Silwood1]|nr:unnamed protein product [Rotaria sp. Silwood1]CAF4995113.1 unnamed protein product [Rotaria sp. Silwood1]
MVDLLRYSLVQRTKLSIPKQVAQPIIAYDFHKECQSVDELEQIKYNHERLMIEALLIRERILFSRNDPRIPNVSAVKLLLAYGKRWIDVDDLDEDRGDTALHIISRSTSSNSQDLLTIIEMLLNAGAHIDFINYYGRTPLDEAVNSDVQMLLQSKQTPPRLKCLCARLIRNYQMFNNYFWPEHGSYEVNQSWRYPNLSPKSIFHHFYHIPQKVIDAHQ